MNTDVRTHLQRVAGHIKSHDHPLRAEAKPLPKQPDFAITGVFLFISTVYLIFAVVWPVLATFFVATSGLFFVSAMILAMKEIRRARDNA